MAEGRQRAEWRRTAELKATIVNCHRDDKVKSSPWTWQDFFPFADEPEDQPVPRRTPPEEIRRAVLGW